MNPTNSIKDGRRQFVTALGAGGLALLLTKRARAEVLGPLTPEQRRQRALNIRQDQAVENWNAAHPSVQPTNGDEEALPNRIGTFTKALPHNDDGEVDPAAYQTLVRALDSGSPNEFERISLGGSRKLVNPQAGLSYDLVGGDGPDFRVPAPPRFSSREEGAELAENYWMAALRDVPFADYGTSTVAHAAAADLTRFGADAKVPKTASDRVTPELLFRGLTPGDRVGPYLSQYFYLPCPFGGNDVQQLTRSPLAGVDFMKDHASWLAVQNGFEPGLPALESTLRYMRDGRAIGEWVHIDVLFQAYFMSFLVLAGLGAPLDPANPYANSRSQLGLVTFGGAHVASLLCQAAAHALHATWYQKWFAHRRLRPEAFAGAVHSRLYRGGSFDRFPVEQEILDSLSSASRLGGYLTEGSALLPMAFPEGSPTHPAYTAGHATVAGACVTVLKAFFDESWVLPNPVQPSRDGLSLLPFDGALTVGGELNKVASNVALGRDHAGVHWRSDATESLRLGESVALQLIHEQNQTFNESWEGLSLTKFDGTRVTI